MADPLPKYARVNPQDPIAFAVCDRCGFWRNRTDLVFQAYWAGTHLFNTGALVCYDRCLDVPNEQLRTIIIPPDPMPVLNSRVPAFAFEEYTSRIVQFADPTLAQPPWGDGPQLTRCINFVQAEPNSQIVRELQYLTSI